MMETVDIREAETHWFSLMERVEKGESFIISKAGKPLGKLVPSDGAEEKSERSIGEKNR